MRGFNLSLDDFCPHPRAGLGFESIMWCDKLIDEFPGLKINLFIPLRYKRLGEKEHFSLDTNPKYKGWIDKVKNHIICSGNYRIGAHGVNHVRERDGKHPNSNNDEFQYINRITAEAKVDVMFNLFDKVFGIDPENNKTFRPPGWKISKSAVEVLIEKDFKIAGSKEYYNKYKNKIPNLSKHWVSYNWDLTGPCKETGDVVAYGHTSDWTNNYMNEDRYKLLKDFLDSEEFEFRWIEEW